LRTTSTGTIFKYFLYVPLGIAAFFIALGLLTRDKTVIPEGFKGSYMEISGIKLRVHRQGAGPDVLLIHGLPGCVEDWDPVMGHLAERFRVTAYDRPGHGFSGAGGDYTMAANADITLELIRALGIKEVIVVGHCYGGGVALAMAARKPAPVKACVCVSAISFPIESANPVLPLVRLPFLGRGVAVLTCDTLGDYMVTEGMRFAYSPNEKYMTEEIIKLQVRAHNQPKALISFAMEERGLSRELPGLSGAFRDIDAPLIILHGARDRLVPSSHAYRLNETVTGSRLYILDGVGHQAHIVRPDAVIAAVYALSSAKR